MVLIVRNDIKNRTFYLIYSCEKHTNFKNIFSLINIFTCTCFLFLYSLAQVTKIIFAITTWISYALQGYVTADIIWHKYLSKRVKDTSKHVLFELLTRAGIVLLTCKLMTLYEYIHFYYYCTRDAIYILK